MCLRKAKRVEAERYDGTKRRKGREVRRAAAYKAEARGDNMNIGKIIDYKSKEIERRVKDTVSDGMRELYCMLLVAERGEKAVKTMDEDEYYLAVGALEEVKKAEECQQAREEYENSLTEEVRETQNMIRKAVMRELTKEPRSPQDGLFMKFVEKAFVKTHGFDEAHEIVFDEHGLSWKEGCDD
jgi:polyribonucleotide nucleotidyltransferase